MIGPILVFLAVCALVAIYMAIVHLFLNASEKEISGEREVTEQPRPEEKHDGSPASSPPAPPSAREPQWAH
jgi:hypothetical protein